MRYNTSCCCCCCMCSLATRPAEGTAAHLRTLCPKKVPIQSPVVPERSMGCPSLLALTARQMIEHNVTNKTHQHQAQLRIQTTTVSFVFPLCCSCRVIQACSTACCCSAGAAARHQLQRAGAHLRSIHRGLHCCTITNDTKHQYTFVGSG
jgi:hypothetical protein